jgi:hypothetical protein
MRFTTGIGLSGFTHVSAGKASVNAKGRIRLAIVMNLFECRSWLLSKEQKDGKK